ncbi:HD-GYP domain-containing protein [uncultured Rhodoferax sp.]|uniref:HD-GYP domain-containing protein n=1 Tax=uncultured Rhodoferax sp. TaxID=223188 RepID=UPI0025DBEA60|nr:HD-GYP domain-containing protein [uncultured Rhodoferax sp.]
MTIEDSVWVDLGQLRIGLYIELDVGWMSHPFPTGSFKISSHKQIETLQSLGLTRIRSIPSKSDPDPAAEQAALARAQAAAVVDERQLAAQREKEARRQRMADLAAQDRALVVCERRFGESVRLYRKVMDQAQTQPKAAAEQCQDMVGTYVGELMDKGEASIRLLSEAAGDKSSMHPVNVTIVSLLLGKAMGLQQAELQDLGVAAFLHDIGKVKVPDRVRWVEENFSTAEYRMYQEHVAQGVLLARAMELRSGAQLALAQHHEFADGSGFPARIKGEAMSVPGRILALVNRYDNLCNPSRPATALTPHEALSLIFAQLKTRFDAAALSAFIRMMGVYPPGSVVQLIDDRYAIVVSVNSARPLKPRVIVHDPSVPKHEALILDLEHAPQLGIRRSLKPSALPPSAQDYLSPRQRICYFFEQAPDAESPDSAA